MKTANPIDLLFAEMDKLGPGSDRDTLYVLRSLPKHRFDVVVDAGCGAGRQTMALVKELNTRVEAVDSYRPILHRLKRRDRKKCGAALFVQPCNGQERD